MNEIFLGLDLCDNNMQISFCKGDSIEPESIYQLNNTETYLLPNTMYFSTDENKWYVGSEVSRIKFSHNGKLVDDVVGNVGTTNQLIINGVTYNYEDLLLILLKTQIEEFMVSMTECSLAALTVTVERYNKNIFDVLSKLKEELNIEKFCILSHENAFFQYIMNQDESVRSNSISMFEFDTEGMYYYRMDRKKLNSTVVYSLTKTKLEEIEYSMVFGDREQLDELFAKVALKKMRETYISSVFLTGTGFKDKWIKKSQNVLCDGRRVFIGQNIYTKGACYHAKHGAYEKGRDMVLNTNDFIAYDIGVRIGDQTGKTKFYPITLGGREWYNMKGTVNLFLDDTNRVEIIYRNRITDETQKEVVEIHGLPKRPPKTTKLSIEVELYDEKNGAIIIRDMGFGKIYPTTNKIYRKEISWAE
ncbi:MAG: hypothetical protein K6G76_02560 [Lachnospiraceae bacterium]|nr:hypothetical protein [Lachnospiraceae bacterium]